MVQILLFWLRMPELFMLLCSLGMTNTEVELNLEEVCVMAVGFSKIFYWLTAALGFWILVQKHWHLILGERQNYDNPEIIGAEFSLHFCLYNMQNSALAKWDHLCEGKNIQEKKKKPPTDPLLRETTQRQTFVPSYVRSYSFEELKTNSHGQ